MLSTVRYLDHPLLYSAALLLLTIHITHILLAKPDDTYVVMEKEVSTRAEIFFYSSHQL